MPIKINKLEKGKISKKFKRRTCVIKTLKALSTCPLTHLKGLKTISFAPKDQKPESDNNLS